MMFVLMKVNHTLHKYGLVKFTVDKDGNVCARISEDSEWMNKLDKEDFKEEESVRKELEEKSASHDTITESLFSMNTLEFDIHFKEMTEEDPFGSAIVDQFARKSLIK